MAETTLPAGEYAIVEIMGHRTMIGRVEEVERFGAKLLQIEPLLAGNLLTPVMIGGASIYQFTPCSAAIAAEQAPKEEWQLPPSVRAVIPAALLPDPDFEPPAFLTDPIPTCPDADKPDHEVWDCLNCMPF